VKQKENILRDGVAAAQTPQRAEETKALLLGEAQHRIKNTLATVQAIAGQTLREVPAQQLQPFIARLQAFGEAHDLLAREHWEQAPLREVIARALKPFGDRFTINGPPESLSRANLLDAHDVPA
jgi:two-component sensor histidine kinase